MPTLTSEIMQALCRTLFHSLWQGLLLAALAGVVVMFTKKLRPAARYNILTVLLFVFTAGVAITFYRELGAAGTQADTQAGAVANIAPAENIDYPYNDIANQQKPLNVVQTVFAWCNLHANFIVSAWMLVIVFRCLQMLIGLRGVYLLKRRAIFSAGEFWNERLRQLAQNIHVKRQVTLLQSAIAKVPMVIGHLKPVILLPAGVLTALPQDEVEAILLHELAHIRRKDYLVNMLQNFCGILFFFNPAVLWLLSLIKDERENCCDDIALGEVKNKNQFIHALISFQEYNMALSNYAVGFPGRRDHLLNRVKRIITNNNNSLTNMEKTILATSIVLVSFVTMAFAQTKHIPAPAKKAAVNKESPTPEQTVVTAEQHETSAQAAVAETNNDSDQVKGKAAEVMVDNGNNYNDTIPAGHIDENLYWDDDSSSCSIVTNYNGKEYKIKMANDVLVELYIDGQKIPKEKFADYKETVDNIVAVTKEQARKARMMAAEARKHAREMRMQADTMRRQAERMRVQARIQSEQLREQARLMRIQADTSRRQHEQMRQQARIMAEQSREQARLSRIQSDTVRQQAERMRLQARLMSEQSREQARLSRIQADTSRRQAERMRLQARLMADRSREQGRLMRMQADTMRRHAERARLMAGESRRQAAELIDNVIDDLADEGVITSKQDISFSLNDGELTVNGVKQPEALHQKLKDKYLQSAGDNLSFSRTGNSSSSNISIQKKK